VSCFVYFSLVVDTSAIDCLETLVSEMTHYLVSGTISRTHSLTEMGVDELQTLYSTHLQ